MKKKEKKRRKANGYFIPFVLCNKYQFVVVFIFIDFRNCCLPRYAYAGLCENPKRIFDGKKKKQLRTFVSFLIVISMF